MPAPSSSLSRRRFLATGAAAVAAPLAGAIEPFARPGAPRIGLSLAAYSFRNYFQHADHPRDAETAPAKRIDLFQFLDFCAAQGCEGAELTSYYFPKDCDADFLRRVKRHAFLSGVAVSGTAVGNTFTHPAGPKRDREIAHVKLWVDRAAILGAPHIRVFAGGAEGQPAGEAKQHCITALGECCAYAGERGVFLGLENHGGIVAASDALIAIVRAVDSPWLGINLDSGNFHTADPWADLAKCTPYAVNVQFKAEMRAAGRPAEPCDPARLVALLRAAKYQGFLALEYENREDPYTAVPRLLGDLKRALAASS
ncbi:MAG: sugar phosphate isomerase/epimerase family protein [Limisphaerales bacterium]